MKHQHPTEQECMKLLEEYGTPDHVIRHCKAVADVALIIAEALSCHGFHFDLPLIRAAGLCHDIARTMDKHWIVGADFFAERGYALEADIIREHMTHQFDSDPKKLTELDMVCLGDRLVLEDQFAGYDARMDYVIKKANGNKKIEDVINQKRKVGRALISNIEAILGKTMEELMVHKGTLQ